MKLMNIYFLNFVLILILFNCQEVDAQIGMCNLDTVENANNSCSSSNYLVYLTESVCESSGGKNCWCILVDNRNREYDGQQMEIEMDHSFRVTWMQATRADLDNNSLDLKFIITPGINQISFEPYTSLAPINVVSLKINGLEVCKSLNRQKRQIYLPYQEEFYVEPNNFQFQTVSQTKREVQNTKKDYRFYYNCKQNPNYTANSEHFCPNDVSDFTIEKRYLLRGERYWCVRINNENNVFNSENRLKITYSSQNRHVEWNPLDSYIRQNNVRSGQSKHFHLGARHTTVTVSANTGELPDITSVTIDGHSICNYFQSQVTAPPPPRSTTMIYTLQLNPGQSGNYPVHNAAPPHNKEQNTQSDKRFLQDCKQNPSYTANSEHFCPNDVSNFTIEKRYLLRDKRYWCVRINNVKNVFNSENELKITYSSQNRHIEWEPSKSYIRQNNVGSGQSKHFHLGARHTTVTVSANTGELLDITSVTIDGHSICNYFQSQVTAPPPPRATTMIYTPQLNPGQSGNYPVHNAAPPHNKEQNTQSDKRFLQDCKQNPSYTANSEHFCPNDVSNFTIEKRYLLRDKRYWCVRINNVKNVFNSENELKITYSSQNRHIEWEPSKSYIRQNNVGSGQSKHFHLGARHTTVTVSANTGELLDITSVTIDGHSICNYFQSQVTAPPPPRSTTMIYTPQLNPGQSGNYPVHNAAPPHNKEQNTQSDKRFLQDCKQNPSYTANSEHFCPNDVSNFTIEKRYLLRDKRYWCVRINNVKNVFNSENELKITYSSQNRHIEWEPSKSYIRQNNVGSGQSKHFHLGARNTTVTVSANTGELPDITSVTIDGHSICNYFQPQVTAPPPPMEPQNKPSVIANCGIKPLKQVPLIYNGLDTNPGDWPWHAAIYKLQSKTNRNYTCGGTLINRKTVITAAHCVLELNKVIIPDRLIVELGRYDLSMATPDIQEFKVFEVKRNEMYNPITQENDIAILVLANYVQLTAYVNFICLPEPNMNLVNQVGKTVGWGLDENNELQTELKEASLPVVDIFMCLNSNPDFFGHFITKTNFCAGYRNKTSVCRGDSGGGLVFQRDNHWILGGITSFGVASASTKQCDTTQYAIFTDVTKFIDWIKLNT